MIDSIIKRIISSVTAPFRSAKNQVTRATDPNKISRDISRAVTSEVNKEINKTINDVTKSVTKKK